MLNRRGCLIPQTYEAHGPENVVHASLERAGSSDWAVLCSAEGTVSLLVFFGSTPAQLVVLASAPETERLQAHDPSGVLGFNWGIDPASPEQIRTAQIGLLHRPALAHERCAALLLDIAVPLGLIAGLMDFLQGALDHRLDVGEVVEGL